MKTLLATLAMGSQWLRPGACPCGGCSLAPSLYHINWTIRYSTRTVQQLAESLYQRVVYEVSNLRKKRTSALGHEIMRSQKGLGSANSDTHAYLYLHVTLLDSAVLAIAVGERTGVLPSILLCERWLECPEDAIPFPPPCKYSCAEN